MHAAITFNSGNPVAFSGSALVQSASQTSATISDSLGNVLFYSNGRQVWNRNNTLMPNGSGLFGGNITCSQPIFVVPNSSDKNQYFLFTVGSADPTVVGLHYSLIDMTLQGGLGDVVSGMKNIYIPGGDSAVDQLTGIRHKNNKDVWVVVRRHGPKTSYLAYLVTIFGISLDPVVSSSNLPTRYQWGSLQGIRRGGDLKISQDGTKLVCSDSLAEICDFNSLTGVVTPKFNIYINQWDKGGAEFSVDSKYLYMTEGDEQADSGWQFDLSYQDSLSFVQHKIGIGDGLWEHLQLGPNWKIYNCMEPFVDSINCINNPSSPGLACNYQKNAISLAGNMNNHCLIQFLQRYKAYFHFIGTCIGDTTHFTNDIWPPSDSVHWDFGDPASGAANFSNLTSPSHFYSSIGTYIVELFVRHIDNRTDTSWRVVNIYPLPKPTLGSDQTICIGDTVTFNAGTCSGCSYLWTNLGTGDTVGTSQIFRTGLVGSYMVTVTNLNGCHGTDTVQLFTTPVPQVTNNPLSKTICSGESTNIPLTSNAPGTMFHWTATLTSGTVSGFLADSGLIINQVLLNNIALPGVITYHITPKVGSCIGTIVDFPVTVNATDSVKVFISVSNNNICSGTPVTFTAVPTNGGITPSYQWKVNGINAGSNNAVYTYSPNNGDVVTCILTSSITQCTSNNPATSNSITMIVSQILPVSVNITPSANPVCAGTSVTFTATPTNGGSILAYEWKVNGVIVGANSPTYTYTPINGDQVKCILTSGEVCVTNNPATSNIISMNIIDPPVVIFTRCFDSITTINAKPIKLKGGIPLGGTYSGPGVNSVTGVFTPSAAGIGTKTITYSFTNVALCSANKTKNIIVQSSVAFTCGNNLIDIRDNKVYPTIQIGSQCWMAANLNYGIEIPSTQNQRDNCVPEKYKSAVGSQQSAFYQWDELMRYDDTPAQQGLCPPAWHVPTEAEWNTLFANWTNNAFAGAPLKYSGYSGFDALLSGVIHLNVQWDYQNFATFFWSSTPHGTNKAWSHGMNDYDYSVSVYPSFRSNAFSVRCLKD